MTEDIRADFDRLALLDGDGWNHNSHYHPFLLRQVPAKCGEALEIGCGTGAFSRLLAERSAHVLGLDLSPTMVRIARERSQYVSNVDYQVTDVLAWDWPCEQFDCIVSIATFHHLPLEMMLERTKQALKPGGVLLVLDLFRSEWPGDLLTDLFSAALNPLLKLVKTGRLREPVEVRAAWAEHGKHDRYLTLRQVQGICQKVVPNAEVRRRLFWRYSMVWKRPI